MTQPHTFWKPILLAALALLLWAGTQTTPVRAQEAEPTWVDDWYGETHTGPQAIPVMYADADPQPVVFVHETSDPDEQTNRLSVAGFYRGLFTLAGLGGVLFFIWGAGR